MKKAIFLDRDGTINIDEGYTYKTEHLVFFPDVFESLNLLKDKFIFIIITNQMGINKGLYRLEDVDKFNNKLIEELKKEEIEIKKVYICPHLPEEGCSCRKPKLKFIEDAKKEFNIDLKNSFVIGDHPSDVYLGKNAGVRAVYLLTGHGTKHKDELRKEPDFIAKSLLKAAEWIIKQKDL